MSRPQPLLVRARSQHPKLECGDTARRTSPFALESHLKTRRACCQEVPVNLHLKYYAKS